MASPKTIIKGALAFTLAAIVLPIGVTQIFAANTTGWDTAVTTIFTVVLPILGVVGLAMDFIKGGK